MLRRKRYDGFVWSGIILVAPILYGKIIDLMFSSAALNFTFWMLGYIVLAFLCVLYLKKESKMDLFQFGKPNLSKIAWMLLSFFVLLLWAIVCYRLFPVSQNTKLILDDWTSSSYMRLLMPFVAIIGAPIYEEITIRALPMQLLKPYARYGLDIIITATIFACGHMHGLMYSDFVSYFVTGIVHALLIRKTKSIYYSIGLHSMWNGFIYLGRLLVGIL